MNIQLFEIDYLLVAMDDKNTFNPKQLGFCPYQILDIPRPTFTQASAISDEQFQKNVGSKYRKKALQYHPDRFPNDKSKVEKFLQLKRASDILKDPELRKIYDGYLQAKVQNELRYQKQTLERQTVINDLLRREKEFEQAAESEYQNQSKPKQKKETEFDRIVRETKEEEKR